MTPLSRKIQAANPPTEVTKNMTKWKRLKKWLVELLIPLSEKWRSDFMTVASCTFV